MEIQADSEHAPSAEKKRKFLSFEDRDRELVGLPVDGRHVSGPGGAVLQSQYVLYDKGSVAGRR